MAQAKKQVATKTTKKVAAKPACKKACAKKTVGLRFERVDRNARSNTFFVVSMTFLAATLLFADLLFIMF